MTLLVCVKGFNIRWRRILYDNTKYSALINFLLLNNYPITFLIKFFFGVISDVLFWSMLTGVGGCPVHKAIVYGSEDGARL